MKNMLAITIVVAFGLTAFVAGTAVSGEGQEEKKVQMPQMPAPPPQLKALDAFVGEWRGVYEHLPAMMGQPGTGTGKFQSEWVLDGWYLMGKGVSTGTFGAHEMVWLATYDPKMQAYRSFSFDNHGNTTIAEMAYQPASRTWIETSEGIDFKTGKPAKNKSTMRFVGKDKLEWEWLQKVEGATEFTLMMKGTDTRVR
jgi:hypothetical protein